MPSSTLVVGYTVSIIAGAWIVGFCFAEIVYGFSWGGFYIPFSFVFTYGWTLQPLLCVFSCIFWLLWNSIPIESAWTMMSSSVCAIVNYSLLLFCAHPILCVEICNHCCGVSHNLYTPCVLPELNVGLRIGQCAQLCAWQKYDLFRGEFYYCNYNFED